MLLWFGRHEQAFPEVVNNHAEVVLINDELMHINVGGEQSNDEVLHFDVNVHHVFVKSSRSAQSAGVTSANRSESRR